MKTYHGDKTVGDHAERDREFLSYILEKQMRSLLFWFSNNDIVNISYKHRWTEAYKKAILAKMYQLDAWTKRHHLDMVMITLTTSQANLTDLQILDNLKEGWNTLRKTISSMNLMYFALYEPHQSGVAHMHVLVIGKMSSDDVRRLERLWVDKYKMGNEHAFDITFDKKEAINSIVNYLMKYMAKTVKGNSTFTDAELRFHSLFWETGYRQWSSTRYITFVMGIIKKKSQVSCIGISMIKGDYQNSNFEVLWEHLIKQYSKNEFLNKYEKKDNLTVEQLKRANSDVFIPEILIKSDLSIKNTFYERRGEYFSWEEWRERGIDLVMKEFNNGLEVIHNSDGSKRVIHPQKEYDYYIGSDGQVNKNLRGYYVKADDRLVWDVMTYKDYR